VRDGGIGRTRVTFGPELGVGFLGFDAGLAIQTGGAQTYVGWVARPMLTLGFVSIFARFGGLPNEPDSRTWAELGLLLKYPIQLAEEPSHRWEPRGPPGALEEHATQPPR